MLKIQIPGREELILSNLILDYNGTIALDGEIIPGVKQRLDKLRENLEIYVITADTHGTAAKHCEDLPVRVLTYPTTEVGKIKGEFAHSCTGGVVSLGNGFNDIALLEESDLSVCIIGTEGCCGRLISCADVVVSSVCDALDLLLIPSRLRATLRT